MSNGEWDIFGRIENLEQDIKAAKPTLEEATRVAVYAFELAFIALVRARPDQDRKLKDIIITDLKKLGLSLNTLNTLEQLMLKICDIAEKSWR